MSEPGEQFERVRVMVETAERSFRGYIYRPMTGAGGRLSDYLNDYDRAFLSLADVTIHERAQTHRPGEKRDYVAVSIAAITYITPMMDTDI